jgi:ABC-type nitrate/sulfonate/bicarbonate transport system permease component
MKAIGIWLIGLVPLAIGLAIWEASSSADAISFPQPSSWWTAFKELERGGLLWTSLRSTMSTFLIAMVVATVLGVGAGVVIGFSGRLERTLTPLIDFFRTLPPPVIVPVLTLLLGITLKAGVAIVVISVIWPILLNTMGAVHEMPVTRREISSVLGVSRFAAFWKITVPSLLPGIAVGLRTSLSIGLVVTLLVDMIGSGGGIGRLLVTQQQLFDASSVWALLFLIGALGYALNLAVHGATTYLLRHHPSAQH